MKCVCLPIMDVDCCGDGRMDEVLEKLQQLEEKVNGIKSCECSCVPGGEVTIRLSETSKSLKPGDTFQLQAIVGPADLQDKSVTWISSDPTIATVDGNGLVTALAEGSVTITATTNVGGKTAVCNLEIVSAQTPLPEEYAECNILLPFGRSFDENLGTDNADIIMSKGSITCDPIDGGYFNGLATVVVNGYDYGDEWTMGCWVKFEALRTYTQIFMSHIPQFVGLQLSSGKMDIYCYTSAVNRSITPIQKDTWYHFLLNSEAQLYINGAYVATGTKGRSLAGIQTIMGIGNRGDNGYPDRSVIGHMSNFFVTKRLLTATEIGGIYALGANPC